MAELSRNHQLDEKIAPSGQLVPEQTPAFSDVPKRIEIRRALVDTVGAQFEMSSPGSSRRHLFEDLMRGIPFERAIEASPADLGPNPNRTRDLLIAYVQDRSLFEGRVAASNLKPQEVAINRAIAVHIPDVESIQASSAQIGAAYRQANLLNAAQAEAVDREKARINQSLLTLGQTLEKMEQDGLRDTPAYRQAAKDYEEALSQTVHAGAVRVAVTKSVAAEGLDAQWKGFDAREHRLSPEEAASVKDKLHVIQMDQGVAGQVRPAVGARFAGWQRDQDVVLTPAWEASIARKADPNHNADFFAARAEAGEARDFYAYLTSKHQEELDKPLAGKAPKYDPEEALGGAAAAGLVTRHVRPPVDWGGDEKFLLKESARPNPIPIPTAPFDSKASKPLVVTSDHIDSRFHEADLRRQEREIRVRQAVHFGFGAASAALTAIQHGAKLAANPDSGIGQAAIDGAQLTLMTSHQAVTGIMNSQDQMRRISMEALQHRKGEQANLAADFRAKALGGVAQLEALGGDPRIVKALHAAEMEARAANAPRLEQGWNDYRKANSTDLYRELFAQAQHSQNKSLAKLAESGLERVNAKSASGQAFTEQDFNALANTLNLRTIFEEVRSPDGFQTLRNVTNSTAMSVRSELCALERNFMDGARQRYEQEALSRDKYMQASFHRALMGQKGVTVLHGPSGPAYDFEFKDGKPWRSPSPISSEEIGAMRNSKWAVERNIQEANIRLIDRDPLLADAVRRNGLDAASVLEATYSHQASASSNSQRIADAIRHHAERIRHAAPSNAPGVDLIPKGWDIAGEERHIGVADLGNGTYAATLTGYDHKGNAIDSRFLVFQKKAETHELELVGNARLKDPTKMSVKAFTESVREGISEDLTATLKQQEAVKRGIPVTMLPKADTDRLEKIADAQAERLTPFFHDTRKTSRMVEAINMSLTVKGQDALIKTPNAFSIFEYPRRSHVAHQDIRARFNENFNVAVAGASHDVEAGLRQRSELSGLWNTLRRMDSDRNFKEKRGDFDNLRFAFDDPRVRERNKGAVFQNPLHLDSGPGHTPVRLGED